MNFWVLPSEFLIQLVQGRKAQEFAFSSSSQSAGDSADLGAHLANHQYRVH